MSQSNMAKVQKQYSLHKSQMRTSTHERISMKQKSLMNNSMHPFKLQEVSQSGIQSSNDLIINPKFKITSFSIIKDLRQDTKPINISNAGNLLKDYKRKTKRNNLITSIKSQSHLSIFLKKVEEKQPYFDEYCKEERYNEAVQIIIVLLNYSIDLNLPLLFTKGLKIMAELYLLMEKINEAFFYFNQTRQSSILLSQESLLIESLIGLSKSVSKAGLQKQSIIFLKKALQYAWLYELQQLELLIYDEIGRKHYHIGDIEKAKKYHLRYINAICQHSQSALKMLSRQRILKRQELNIEMRYNQLDKLFLVHLKAPIRPLRILPAIISPSDNTVRDQVCEISQKYHHNHQEIQIQVKKTLKNWFFKDEIQETELPSEDWTVPIKLKKFAFIDFKLNQTLKKYNSFTNTHKIQKKQSPFQFKLSLQQKIAKRLKQSELNSHWYESMVNQIKRDRKNKLLNVRNSVRIRGYNKPVKPHLDLMKSVYNDFFVDISAQ